MAKVTIICEFGSSPAPAWDFAPWCAAAANVGADAVKVQLWRTDVIYPLAMRAAMRPREFPRRELGNFAMTAHRYGLTAGASVFDEEAVYLAAQQCDWLKLAASQERNSQLLAACRNTGKPLYRSVTTLVDPSRQYVAEVTLFAIPEYPATMFGSLWKMYQWAYYNRQNSQWRWGWSSHTAGTIDCTSAARLGATVIEKHFALSPADCEAPHSLLPDKFAAMCRAIRKGERNATH